MNGHIFKDSKQLSDLLISIVNDFPSSLANLQDGVEDYNKKLGWEDCWNRDLLPYLEKI
jgi:hypothetical protein